MNNHLVGAIAFMGLLAADCAPAQAEEKEKCLEITDPVERLVCYSTSTTSPTTPGGTSGGGTINNNVNLEILQRNFQNIQ